jgi:tetratricopeptide (TPR) repeat protein
MKHTPPWTVLLGWLLACPCAPAAEPEPQELAGKVRELFTANCHRCHGKDGANEGGFNYILDRQRLLQRRKVVPGDPARSRLFRRISSADDPMPPAEEKVRPGADDIALVRKWIEAGAPDFSTAAARRGFVSQAEVIRAMRADLEGLPARQRRFTRYFTLTHLFNAGLSEDELQSYRHGLSKLVNSLSWGGSVVVPRPVDPARTIFRIDLRDYQWEERTWQRILDANPYGVLVDSEDARACAAATGCRLPHVRADWFVAAASRPPLYHDVLGIPATEQELQKLLRLDVAQNIRQERVARAGFNGSGVSRNNRLIERHEANGVVYWRSYDFGTNTGKQNLFANPLGPGEGGSTFEHDGGEFIFSLPNGLQGYMLADAKGRRLDKGPTAIVSDPKRPDRAVENGLSCMGCHARGLIDKADQLRDHVTRNAQAFAGADVELVQALCPPRERFTALVRQDATRFQEAVQKTGAPLSATEPIVALALRFEAEMDLALAAAEAGCTPDVLRRALDRSPRLAQQLGALLVQGGTAQRPVFVDAFADLVRELKLGEHLESPLTRHDRLLRRGELLRREGDPAGAVEALSEALEAVPTSARAFHQRGLAHHDRRQLEKAIADYTEAIRLDPRDAVARHNRGFAHYDRQDFDRALADLDEAIRLDPRYATAWNNRGLTQQRRGNPERALADFSEAIRLAPTQPSAWYNRGGVHLARGEHQKAVADYTEAIRLDPKNASAHNNRGLARDRTGDHRGAVADFTQAIALNPRFTAAHHNRGLAHHALQQYDRAVADFSEAIRLDPNFASAYYHRAEAHRRNGNAAQAQRDRARALELDPDLDD